MVGIVFHSFMLAWQSKTFGPTKAEGRFRKVVSRREDDVAIDKFFPTVGSKFFFVYSQSGALTVIFLRSSPFLMVVFRKTGSALLRCTYKSERTLEHVLHEAFSDKIYLAKLSIKIYPLS